MELLRNGILEVLELRKNKKTKGSRTNVINGKYSSILICWEHYQFKTLARLYGCKIPREVPHNQDIKKIDNEVFCPAQMYDWGHDDFTSIVEFVFDVSGEKGEGQGEGQGLEPVHGKSLREKAILFGIKVYREVDDGEGGINHFLFEICDESGCKLASELK